MMERKLLFARHESNHVEITFAFIFWHCLFKSFTQTFLDISLCINRREVWRAVAWSGSFTFGEMKSNTVGGMKRDRESCIGELYS